MNKYQVTLKEFPMKRKIFLGSQHNYRFDYFKLPEGTEVHRIEVSNDMNHLWLEWYTGEIAEKDRWTDDGLWFRKGDRMYDRAEIDIIVPYASSYDFSKLVGDKADV